MRALILLATMFATANAFGAIQPFFQDIKLPTQEVVEHQTWAYPYGSYSTFVLNGAAGPTSSAALTISSGFSTAKMDFARNLTITPAAANYNSQAACTVTVSGTNYLNHPISEAFVLSANQSTAVVGVNAFATVTSVAFPASCENSPYAMTYNLGLGVKFGLKRCMNNAGAWTHSVTNATKDVTAATVVVGGNSTVSLNTAQFNTAPNSTNNYEAYFMQNFLCTY